ncbi:MAG: hypothetical protein HUJ78_00005 [Mogibacterium sp.]|nr:hypothetical protein [Mogibacterium sp.]
MANYVADFTGAKTSGVFPERKVQQNKIFTMPTQLANLKDPFFNENYKFEGWSYDGQTYAPGATADLTDVESTVFIFQAVWSSAKYIIGTKRYLNDGDYISINYFEKMGDNSGQANRWLLDQNKEDKQGYRYLIKFPKSTESTRLTYAYAYEPNTNFAEGALLAYHKDTITEYDLNGCIWDCNNTSDGQRGAHAVGIVISPASKGSIIFKSSADLKGRVTKGYHSILWTDSIANVLFENIEFTGNYGNGAWPEFYCGSDSCGSGSSEWIFRDCDIHDNDCQSFVNNGLMHSIFCFNKPNHVIQYESGKIYNEGGWHTTDQNSIWYARGTLASFQKSYSYCRLSLGKWKDTETPGPEIYNLGTKSISLYHMPYWGALYSVNGSLARIDVWNADIHHCYASNSGGFACLDGHSVLLLHEGCKIHDCINYNDFGNIGMHLGGAITLVGDDNPSNGAGAFWLARAGHRLEIYGGKYYNNEIKIYNGNNTNSRGGFLGIEKPLERAYDTYYDIYGGEFYNNKAGHGGVVGFSYYNNSAKSGTYVRLKYDKNLSSSQGIKIHHNEAGDTGGVFCQTLDHCWLEVSGDVDIYQNKAKSHSVFGYDAGIYNMHYDLGNKDLSDRIHFPRIHHNHETSGNYGIGLTTWTVLTQYGALVRLFGNLQIFSNTCTSNNLPGNFRFHQYDGSPMFGVYNRLGEYSHIEYEAEMQRSTMQEGFTPYGSFRWLAVSYDGDIVSEGDEYKFQCNSIYRSSSTTPYEETGIVKFVPTVPGSSGNNLPGRGSLVFTLGKQHEDRAIFIGKGRNKYSVDSSDKKIPYISDNAFSDSGITSIYISGRCKNNPEVANQYPWGAESANIYFGAGTDYPYNANDTSEFPDFRYWRPYAVLFNDRVMEFSWDFPESSITSTHYPIAIYGGYKDDYDKFTKYQSIWWYSDLWNMAVGSSPNGSGFGWDSAAWPRWMNQPNIYTSSKSPTSIVWNDNIPVHNYSWFAGKLPTGVDFRYVRSIKGTPGGRLISSLNRAFQNYSTQSGNVVKLEELDLDFNSTENLYNTICMCEGQSKLTKIDGIENWDTNSLRWVNGMFKGCTSLEAISFRSWKFTDDGETLNQLGKSFIKWNLPSDSTPNNINELGPIFGPTNDCCTGLKSITLPKEVENLWPSGYDTPDKWGAPNATVYYVN